MAIMLTLGTGAGCVDPVTLATMAAVDEIWGDEESNSPSDIIITGMFIQTDPCQFDLDLVSSDDDGHVADFRQTQGNLPPGYSMTVEEGDVSDPSVSAGINGPPVNAGYWTAFFVAVDNEGNESSEKEVLFICDERPE